MKMSVADSIQDHAEYEQLKLTPEQIDMYWEQGYLSNIPVLSEEQCEILLKDYRTVFHPVSTSLTTLFICSLCPTTRGCSNFDSLVC